MTVPLFCPHIPLFRLGGQSFEIAGPSSRDAAQFSRNFMRLSDIQSLDSKSLISHNKFVVMGQCTYFEALISREAESHGENYWN
jgi:hypothetical protein